MQFLESINYVYRVEMIAIAGIVLLLVYIFYMLDIFSKKR